MVDVKEQRRTLLDDTWVPLPLADQQLTAITQIGNGKDADMRIEFVSGKRIDVAAVDVRVHVDRGVVVETTAWGDTALKIKYTGSNLLLRSGRIRYCEVDERERFQRAARKWFKSDFTEDLTFEVEMELELTATEPVVNV